VGDEMTGGIVDKGVDAAKLGFPGGNRVFDSGEVLHVGQGVGGRLPLDANGFDGFLQRSFAADDEEQGCTEFGESTGRDRCRGR
jgi:hypothetical protein